MLHLNSKWLALLAGALLATGSAFAQDSGPLVDLLVKKGIVTDQEAEDLRADLAKEAGAGVVANISGGKSTIALTFTGRLQVQFDNFSGSVDGATTNPTYVNHFLMRRVYFGVKADLTGGWSADFNYDFANASFDRAFIEWRKDDSLLVDIGFRKVPIGLEEWETSSGSLKAIERSMVTRYFVESNNGRRLGAGSYRVGVFAGGKTDQGFYYNAAVTNPERDEYSSLSGNSDPGVQNGGTAATNVFAFWGNAGYKAKFEGGFYELGASAGYLPDQGGLVLGKGNNLSDYAFYGIYNAHGFDLEGEYWLGKDQNGNAAGTADASPKGYWIQPAYFITDKLEAVIRYTSLDTDGRGVSVSDAVRSAPSTASYNKMTEWYFGGNYLFKGNDVKLQLGYIHAEGKDTVLGAPAGVKVDGVRSQMQLNF